MVEEYCKNYITFESWEAETAIVGFPNTTVEVHKAIASFFSTRDEQICPITSLSINVVSGNASEVTFFESKGAMSVNIANNSLELEFTACGG